MAARSNGGMGGLHLHGPPCMWPFCTHKGRNDEPEVDQSDEEDEGAQRSRNRIRPTTPRTNSFPSSTSDLCSRTRIASDCSVYCESHSTSTTTRPCSTICFSTITGCSVSGVTTTTTESPTGSINMCSPYCANCRDGGVLVPRISVSIHKRMLPTPSSGPAGITAFMQTQTENATRVPLRESRKAFSTALHEPMLDAVVNMTVTGLYGCSSVVVLSKSGIYMSHLWERPLFKPYVTATFDKQILQALKDGDGARMPGLLALSQHNSIFAPNSDPATFIITPRVRLPWDDPDDTRPQYPFEVNKIKISLKSLIKTPAGPVEPTVLTYIPQRDAEDPHQKDRVSGKILFQYDPFQPLPPSTNNKGCLEPRQQPMLRLWVAASRRPVFEKTWMALPFQLGPRKRGLPLDTCGVPNPETTQAADAQEISQELATRTSASATIVSTEPSLPQLSSNSHLSPTGIGFSVSSSMVYRTSTITVVPLPLSSSIVYQTSTITVVPLPLSSYRISTITVIPLPQSTATTMESI